MKAKIISNEAEYRAALSRIETLMDAAPGSAKEQELELLSVLVEAYEKQHHPIPLPDPIEAIKSSMEQQGLTRKDLEPYIGTQSKVSEVLNRKRPLSLSMIRALEKGLGIPAEVLLQETVSSPRAETPGKTPRGTSSTYLYALREADSRPYLASASPPRPSPSRPEARPSSPDLASETRPDTWSDDAPDVFAGLCEAFGITAGQEDDETAFFGWYEDELRRITRLSRSGESRRARDRVDYLEYVLRTYARDEPLLAALAATLRELGGLLRAPSEGRTPGLPGSRDETS